MAAAANPQPVPHEVLMVQNESGAPGMSDWEGDVVLVDGATVHMRAMRVDDERRLARMYERMSADSVYYRFFSPVPRATATSLELNRLGDAGHVALVAVFGDDIVAAARYDVVKPGVAEVAFVVADDYQTARGGDLAARTSRGARTIGRDPHVRGGHPARQHQDARDVRSRGLGSRLPLRRRDGTHPVPDCAERRVHRGHRRP